MTSIKSASPVSALILLNLAPRTLRITGVSERVALTTALGDRAALRGPWGAQQGLGDTGDPPFPPFLQNWGPGTHLGTLTGATGHQTEIQRK